ncbi:HET-domain-containing protein [Phaeosphaeriaceae sp. SRC1lsM3a]|nr:HET-domain-containing protein [Stagonospora sp. SRC1lsM3a]
MDDLVSKAFPDALGREHWVPVERADQNVREPSNSTDQGPLVQTPLDEVCEHCKRLDFSAEPSILNPESHNCALSRALIQIFDQRGIQGIIRYTPEWSDIDLQKPHRHSLAYFQRGNRLYSPGRDLLSISAHTFNFTTAEDFVACPHITNPFLANLTHAKLWLAYCRQQHGSECKRTSQDIVAGLKVIDCQNKKICAAEPREPYATLSYVWGSSTYETSATSSSPTSFPRTIEDALVVSRELGVGYLWVDRYCIDQNNEQEKHDMIANMDKIYAQSDFTIVATAGIDPRHGLPGISATIRQGMYRIALGNGYLDWFADPVSEVHESVWNQRAWTYQEMLLSPRCLVFTESQMLFECSTQDFRESINTPCRNHAVSGMAYHKCSMMDTKDDKVPYPEPSNVFPKYGIGDCPEDIYDRICEYSRRKLTHRADKLNAIDGIFSAFRRGYPGDLHRSWGIPAMKDPGLSFLRGLRWMPLSHNGASRAYLKHFWGIPIMKDATLSFLRGLCWKPLSRDRASEVLWPTWSWVSASEQIYYHRGNFVPDGVSSSRAARITVTHLNGRQESLSTFARGSRDYREYQPWVDIRTWLNCPPKTRYDRDNPDLCETFTALFLCHSEVAGAATPAYFLLARERDDGSFQRVGIATRYIQWKVLRRYLRKYEFRTVRLV